MCGDHPRRAFGGLYHCAKFGWNRCSSFENMDAVSYTHLRAHETDSYLVCRLLLEKKFEISKMPDGGGRHLEKSKKNSHISAAV